MSGKEVIIKISHLNIDELNMSQSKSITTCDFSTNQKTKFLILRNQLSRMLHITNIANHFKYFNSI